MRVIASSGAERDSAPSTHDQECFPPALRFSLAADGSLSDAAAAPIAADLRKVGDGRRLALLKLLAALTGLRLDELAQREAQRRTQRLRLVAGASLAACLFTGGLAIYANVQRIEAERQRNVAEKESAASKATADFLISTFTLSNPATENPRTITALTILGRSADRSRSELRGQPGIGPDPATFPTTQGHAAEIMGVIDDDELKLTQSIADYDRALKFYAAVPNIDAQIIARTLNNRGAALSDKGRYQDAEESLLKANAIWRRTLGDSHLKVGQSYFALSQNALSAGQLTKAEAYAGKSLAILEPLLEKNNPLVADALVSQGAIYEAQKRPAEAKAALSAAVQRYRDAYRAPHYSIGIAEVYLSLAESQLGDTAEALKTIDDAKIQYDVSYGHLHANHGDRLVYRAIILKRSGRFDDARHDCSEGLAIIAKTSEADSALYKADADMCAGL
jgi:Tetratricopeptide repeat